MDESRRGFLKTGAKALAASAATEGFEAWHTQRKVLGASDRVRVAIVGLRGAGAEDFGRFGALPNVEMTALCDIDDSVMREQIQLAQKLGFRPKTYIDIRKLLEDKSIDAVSIGTQNHWHSLMAIWACQVQAKTSMWKSPVPTTYGKADNWCVLQRNTTESCNTEHSIAPIAQSCRR